MPRTRLIAALALLAPAALHAQSATTPQAVVDRAIARMGGADALAKVERARFDMITQWLRTTFDREPGADGPSYELHTDTRDYTVPAWRNVRRFPTPGGGARREMTDVVRDTVAIRRMGGADAKWQPLSVAYVDERHELFAISPERLLPAVRAAHDLRLRGDTTVNGVRYARVSATVADLPVVLLVDARDTGLPAAVHFTAAQPNDFGLAPWGAMDVDVWYARWQRTRTGVAYPTQLDVMRAGKPYKRMTVLAAAFDVPAMPDSFAVTDSLRSAFLATQRHAMHDLPLDSARLVDGTFATFGPFGPPVGAVKVGGQWLLLEAGQAALNAERSAAWLGAADTASRIAGALVTVPYAGNGGVTWLARRGTAIWAAPGARPFVDAMLRNAAVAARSGALVTVDAGRWIKVGTDSVRLERIDLPSGRGAMLAYVPSLKWAYAGMLASPLDMDVLMERVAARGWTVERIGSRRGIAMPVPAPRPVGGDR